MSREPGPDHAALLAWLDGRLVGVASYEPTGKPGVAEIAFAVPDDMHRHGIATLLLEHLVSLARRRGLHAFTAETLAKTRRCSGCSPAFTALGGSAHFDRVLYDGGEFGASAEEEDFLGLPGLLGPEQVALLLRKRRADQLSRKAVPQQRERPAAAGLAGSGGGTAAAFPAAGPPRGPAATPASPPTREILATLRKELNGLIAAWHHCTGKPHGAIHAELRHACGGPPLPEATAEQIRARIQMLRRWASSR